MTPTPYFLIFLIALVCAMFLGWFLRKAVERFENMERVIARRRLPYNTLAGLEDAWALSDMANFENADEDKMEEALLTIVLRGALKRKRSEAFVGQIQEILKVVRADPHGYDAEPKRD